MKIHSLITLSLSLLLCACASQPKKEGLTLKEMACEIEGGLWEITKLGREVGIDRYYPEGVPDDIITYPESGAQASLTFVRLERNVIAVMSLYEVMDGGTSLSVYQKTASGMEDITATAFPYAQTHKYKSIYVHVDKSVTMISPSSDRLQRYLWNGTQFVLETTVLNKGYFEE